MARIEAHLRNELLGRLWEIKELHRDPDTGILDTEGMARHTLEDWAHDRPDSYAEYVRQALVYTAISHYEKQAQSDRARAHRRLDSLGPPAALDLEDLGPGEEREEGQPAKLEWKLPSAEELSLEYHVSAPAREPRESGAEVEGREEKGRPRGLAMVAARLGDMKVDELLKLADFHEQREASARRTKLYLRRLAYMAEYFRKQKGLDKGASLWEIFGIDPAG